MVIILIIIPPLVIYQAGLGMTNLYKVDNVGREYLMLYTYAGPYLYNMCIRYLNVGIIFLIYSILFISAYAPI